MQEEYAISFIIPIDYKYAARTEGVLGQCLDSILEQDFSLFEIIFVNIGREDDMPDISAPFVRRDSRAKSLHIDRDNDFMEYKAFNVAVQEASGRHVMMLPPVDYLAEEALETIVVGGNDIVFMKTNIAGINKEDLDGFTNKRILRNLGDKIMYGFLGPKLIRRNFLIENNIRYIEDITPENPLFVQMDFHRQLYFSAQSFWITDYLCYGLTPVKKTRKSKKESVPEEEFNKILVVLSRWMGQDDRRTMHHWMASLYREGLLPAYAKMPRKLRVAYQTNVHDFRWLLDIQSNRPSKFAKSVSNMFGLGVASQMLRLRHSLPIIYSSVPKSKKKVDDED